MPVRSPWMKPATTSSGTAWPSSRSCSLTEARSSGEAAAMALAQSWRSRGRAAAGPRVGLVCLKRADASQGWWCGRRAPGVRYSFWDAGLCRLQAWLGAGQQVQSAVCTGAGRRPDKPACRNLTQSQTSYTGVCRTLRHHHRSGGRLSVNLRLASLLGPQTTPSRRLRPETVACRALSTPAG